VTADLCSVTAAIETTGQPRITTSGNRAVLNIEREEEWLEFERVTTAAYLIE